jgi:hypothetical protein
MVMSMGGEEAVMPPKAPVVEKSLEYLFESGVPKDFTGRDDDDLFVYRHMLYFCLFTYMYVCVYMCV